MKYFFAFILILLPVFQTGEFNSIQEKEKDSSLIHSSLKYCLEKYTFLFPHFEHPRSTQSILTTGHNYLSFCQCKFMAEKNLTNNKLSIIDHCSAKYLSMFEHLNQFKLNRELLIRPNLDFLLNDHLRFVGPHIDYMSLQNTKHCMSQIIMKNCSQGSSLQLTKKCALQYLEDNFLYQKIFQHCEKLKFSTGPNSDSLEI